MNFLQTKIYLEKHGVNIKLKTKINKIIVEDGVVKGVDSSQGIIEAEIVVSTMSPIILNKLINLNDPVLDKITYIDSVSTKFSGGIFKLTDLNPTLGNNNEVTLNFFPNVDHGSIAEYSD